MRCVVSQASAADYSEASHKVMRVRSLLSVLLIVLMLALVHVPSLHAQDARALVQQAVDAELRANREDHTRWRYRDDERDKGTLSYVVQTDAGSVKRLIARNGHPLSPEEAEAEQNRLSTLIHDSDAMSKQKKDAESDDKSATEFLKMLPDAFVWEVAGQNDRETHLKFKPNPGFSPSSMQARVLGVMAGDLVVSKAQHRIATIRGTLTQDVTFGFGLFGRIRQGGTFDVERREVAPREWQITETHVHIQGKALFFKSIGQQQDEIQSDFKQVTGNTTLEQALAMSRNPS